MEYLSGDVMQGAPYRLVLFENVLPRCDSLLEWLSAHLGFIRHYEDFFDQYELPVQCADLPSDLAWLVSPQHLTGLVKSMNEAFKVPFLPIVRIVFHRLCKGQGIGVHTDESLPGYETHRLVVTLTDRWKDAWGGHFYVMNGNSEYDMHALIRPAMNCGVAFELTPDSFHAVGEVNEGMRHSVVFSFWARPLLDTDTYVDNFRELTKNAIFLD